MCVAMEKRGKKECNSQYRWSLTKRTILSKLSLSNSIMVFFNSEILFLSCGSSSNFGLPVSLRPKITSYVTNPIAEFNRSKTTSDNFEQTLRSVSGERKPKPPHYAFHSFFFKIIFLFFSLVFFLNHSIGGGSVKYFGNPSLIRRRNLTEISQSMSVQLLI